MSNRNTVIRSLHDLGAAAWFGGALMGAIGVNGAAASVRDSRDRARVAAVGWAKWSPVNAAAIAAHLVGGASILYSNRRRAKHQSGVTANTVTKILATGAALGATAYSGALGAKTAQRQLRYLQWVLPVLTGTVVVLGAQQGEQQRPREILTGFGNKLAGRTRSKLPSLSAA
jgi:hypothetical protein